MRAFRRPRWSTLVVACVFLLASLIPELAAPRPAHAASPPPPLAVPEDPVGQRPEQATPEISLDVDVRDGHLTARVVDIWGPGRVPLVMRSYTNTETPELLGDPDTAPSGPPYKWQFNHHLNIVGTSVLEADGNRSSYRYSHDRWSSDQLHLWQVYVKDIGTYSTMEIHYNCSPGLPEGPGGGGDLRVARNWGPGGARLLTAPRQSGGTITLRRPRVETLTQAAPPDCVWDGTHIIYLPKGATKRFQSNYLIEERDANGNVTTYAYTAFGDGFGSYLSTVTDPVGRQTRYTYERGYQKCVRWVYLDNVGQYSCAAWAWVYRVSSAIDPYGRTATYSYGDASLKMTQVNTPAATTIRHTYDSGQRLASVTNARTYATTITWGGNGNSIWVTRMTAPDTTATNYAYETTYVGNGIYRPTRTTVTNARNHATVYQISSEGDVTQETDPLGNLTRYTYDSRRNLTEVTDPRGIRTTYAYNSRNRVTQGVRAAGTLNLTTTLSWDSNDNLLSVTDPRGIRTDYTYTSTHNLASVWRAVGTADEALTQYTYTSWGGVASVIDPLGNTTTYAYTARRQIQTVTLPAGGTTTYTYSSADDQVTMTNGNGRTWTTAYNASRLVTSVTDPLGIMVRHEYDANGNRIRTYDGKNQLTTFAYDTRDRLTSITNPLNGVTAYQYDAVGNPTRITNARNYATTFVYDAANRLTQVTDPLTQSTTYGYDAASNRTSMRDRKGTTHMYTYDQANRLTQVSAGSTTISYAYNATGNRLTMVDPTGTTGFTYDNLDRLTRTTYPDGRTVQAVYDRAGNRTSLTYPGGTVSNTYTYDAANRLTRITQGTLQWTFAYDGAGNRIQLTQPNGTVTVYTYVPNNWLAAIEHRAPGGATLQSVSYGYDLNGNRLTQADATGTTTFTYDAVDRLTQAVYPAGYGTWSWSYDAVGNRTQQVAPGGTNGYTYDANDRLTQAASVVYSYDANGNLTSTSAGRTFSYNPFNSMTQATGPDGTVTHTYNGDGLKTRRVGPDGTTKYYYDGIRPIWETDGAGVMTVQLDRDIFGNLLSRREPTARRYYHFDGLGSTTALTNESGTVVGTMLYDAWGLLRTSTGSGHGKYRYTGAELDTATGLYHMGARFYDPSLGRWLSEDPVQDKAFEPASLNFYSYVANNPLLYVDPTGTTTDLATLNQQRQEIVKKLLELAKGSIDTLAEYLQNLTKLFETLDPATAARSTGWLAGITGTMSTVAMFAGNAPLATGLGMASLVFSAANMYYTDVQYKRGQIGSMGYYFSQAWNLTGLGLGGTGMFAGALRGLPSVRRGMLMAASVVARVFGWGGIALSY